MCHVDFLGPQSQRGDFKQYPTQHTDLFLFYPLHDLLLFEILSSQRGKPPLYCSQCCRWLFAEERLKSLIHLPGSHLCHSA